MTFSIIGRCERTGAFGAAVTTSNLAVGSRCARLSHRKGAFLSQHRTDPRLGDLGISLLAGGATADEAVARVCESTPDVEWRQLAALDAEGRASVYHGRRMYSIYTHSIGRNCVAAGNILANDTITAAMIAAFEDRPEDELSERLLRALEAGRDAGGEILGPLRSSVLRATGEHGLDRCDLRVDISATDAVADLRALKTAYGDQAEELRRIALEPDALPVSRTLFDASVARIEALGLADRFPTARRRDTWTLRG
ncbi:DUF1028 domain-containing protein (plasmid) [Paroceanicella profunda]|uniref:DUF1028 domain-containing protein n=1 Tax=Paroceanicella profunda TaxID=2579971 RepID=A0A5B8G1L7_9RHOB|nr:DUF1028 domain-containing protein [Paroceanicella profunda]QDL93924.1 DUF1028 domain-containing protein [Paroceanicella profunda]